MALRPPLSQSIRPALRRAVGLSLGGAIKIWGPYLSVSAAEASDDAWADRDIIQITDGPDFKYESSYDNSVNGGHSGLVHRFPFGDTEEFAAGAPYTNGLTAGGQDPDSWGFTDASSGTPGGNHDLTSESGLSRLKDLTLTSGRVLLTLDHSAVSAQRTLAIIDAARLVSGSGNNWWAVLMLPVNVPDKRTWIRLSLSQSQANWLAMNDWFVNFTNLGKPGTTAHRIYCYADGENERQAIWFDGDLAPTVINSLPNSGSTTPWPWLFRFDIGNDVGITADLALKYLAVGSFSVG